MAEIIKIKAEDFPGTLTKGSSREEWNAVRDLRPGEAIKFPCRWSHFAFGHVDGFCQGRMHVTAIGKKTKRKFQSECVDKWLHVLRFEEIEKGND